MVGSDGEPNPARVGRDGRRTNGGRIDALCEERLREVHGSIGVTDDHWQNGTFRCRKTEAEPGESLCESFAILPQAGAPLWFLLIAPGWIAWGVISLWFLYRVLRGWLALNDRRPMPT